MRNRIRVRILTCLILAGTLLSGCSTQEAVATPTSTPSPSPPPATATVGITVTPTSTLYPGARFATATAYCYVQPPEGAIFAPPPPALETPFQSEVTESGQQFIGGIVLQNHFTGLLDTQALYIRNVGNADIPISENDFKAYGTKDPNQLVQIHQPGPPGQTWPKSVGRGKQERLDITGNDYYAAVVWTIGGRYGTVTVHMQSGLLVPSPTPKPGCR